MTISRNITVIAVLCGALAGAPALALPGPETVEADFDEFIDEAKMVSGDGVVGVAIAGAALTSENFNRILVRTGWPRPRMIRLEVKTVDGRYEAYPQNNIQLGGCADAESTACKWTIVKFNAPRRDMLKPYDGDLVSIKAYDPETNRVFPAIFGDWNELTIRDWRQQGHVNFYINSESSNVFFRNTGPGAKGKAECARVISKNEASINYDRVCRVTAQQVMEDPEIRFYRTRGSTPLDQIIARLQ